MRKIYLILCVLLISSNLIYASTWDKCINRYEKAKEFQENTRLLYIYLKSTKNCLIDFKNTLIEDPNSEFTVEAMDNNIQKINTNIEKIFPKYKSSKNYLHTIPVYLHINTSKPIYNKEYNYFKKFKNCNGVHANNKIYTAKHCNIKNSKNIRFDLNYIETKKFSDIEVSKIDLNKKGSFKYYSMSKEGMFYNALLEEKDCNFNKVKNTPTDFNTTLDLSDLSKLYEIRSNCLAIPSNSGGGVFQDGKLVGIISKTVFKKNSFLYSVIEPIFPIYENEIASIDP